MNKEEFYNKKAFESDRKHFQEFFNVMIKKIESRMKTKSDSWKHCDLIDLQERLKTEFKEWQTESNYKTGNVSEELIDIANQAMLLWLRINIELKKKYFLKVVIDK